MIRVRLQRLGSQDMAVVPGRFHGNALDNTCLDATRNSFVLVNAHAVHALTACQTTDCTCFSAHSILEACMDVEVTGRLREWRLVKSTSGEPAHQKHSQHFGHGMTSHDLTKHLNKLPLHVGKALRQHVTSDGERRRCRQKPRVQRPSSS